MTKRIIKKSELIYELKNGQRDAIHSVLCPSYVSSTFGRDSDKIANYAKCDMAGDDSLCNRCALFKNFKDYRKDQFNVCIPLIKQVLFENDIEVVDL